MGKMKGCRLIKNHQMRQPHVCCEKLCRANEYFSEGLAISMYTNITIGTEQLEYNIIFVTGSSRVGKTLFAKTVACCENVEWIEEPFALNLLIKLVGLGYIDKRMFRMMFSSMVHELINDCVLLRNANFRANDLSAIWGVKSPQVIFNRLHNVNSRNDVLKYIRNNNTYFLIDMPDVLPFLNIVSEICRNSFVVHVVRHPCDVADSCKCKNWFTDKYIAHSANEITRVYLGHKMPWWVELGLENAFLNASLYDRGLMYWEAIYGHGINTNKELSVRCDQFIKYEDLISNPKDEIFKFINRFGLHKTSLLVARIDEIGSFIDTPLLDRNESIYIKKSNKIKMLMRWFGYEVE